MHAEFQSDMSLAPVSGLHLQAQTTRVAGRPHRARGRGALVDGAATPHGQTVRRADRRRGGQVRAVESQIDLGDHVGLVGLVGLVLTPIASGPESADKPVPARRLGFQAVRDREAGHPA